MACIRKFEEVAMVRITDMFDIENWKKQRDLALKKHGAIRLAGMYQRGDEEITFLFLPLKAEGGGE